MSFITKISSAVCISFVAATLFAGQANAQAAAATVAIVDVKQIVNDSSATKDIRDQITKKRDALQKEVAKKEEELKKADAELSKQRTVLSKEAFQGKANEFKKKIEEVQKDVQNKRSKLEKAYGDALTEVQETVVKIISELSEKKGFSVALPKSQVLFSKADLDISADVMSELNKRLPKVKVDLN